ncbi:MAG: single-stranded DNA-binding protein, partial [Candidatus Cloacimonetes bacterium]|nr:single-stranded DNA-binding protein [Candidatus Cloacimonadota bacterium]
MAKELRLPRVNSIIISGRLTRDIELRYTPNGTPVVKLSLAFDRSYQKDGEWQQETSYIDIVVWSKRAEQCAEFLHKGSPILV